MVNNKNAKKGAKAEKRAARILGAKRKAGPNSPDLQKGKERIEVKNYKKPLTIKQLQNAYSQNHAQIIVSETGFQEETLSYADTNMQSVQLREGTTRRSKVVKRRLSK